MRLASDDGSCIQLDIVGYESVEPGGADDPESYDWLVIRGRFAEGGRTWSFETACLDTDDGRQLLDWLREVADEQIDPGSERRAVGFVEPELILFELAGAAETTVRLRLWLGGAAAPRWATDQQRGATGYPVQIAVSGTSLHEAVADWDRQLGMFPPR